LNKFYRLELLYLFDESEAYLKSGKQNFDCISLFCIKLIDHLLTENHKVRDIRYCNVCEQ